MRPLQGQAVLEISHNSIAANFATRLLGQLGADVIAVDTVPTDSISTHPHLRYLRSSKRSVGINLTHPKGLDVLAELATQAPLVVVGRVGVAPWAVSEGAILDRASSAGSDVIRIVGCQGAATSVPSLLSSAAAGIAVAIGRQEDAPLPLPASLAEYQSGLHAAGTALLSLFARKSRPRGPGNVYTVSELAVLMHSMVENYAIYSTYGIEWMREGHRAAGSGGGYPYTILPCSDGHVALCVRTEREWSRFLKMLDHPSWAEEERYKDFRLIGMRHADEVDEYLIQWLADKSREAVRDLGRRFGIAMGPVNRFSDLQRDDQFVARQFFETVGPSDIRLPGLPFLTKEEARSQLPPPEPFGNTEEILADLAPLHHASSGQLAAEGIIFS